MPRRNMNDCIVWLRCSSVDRSYCCRLHIRLLHVVGGEKLMILAIIAVVLYIPIAVIFEISKKYK